MPNALTPFFTPIAESSCDEHGRGHANQPNAAVRGRRRKPGGVEHRAAADRDEIRVAAERRGVDGFEDAIDVCGGRS